MAQRSTTQLKALYGTSGTIFPDNTTQEISEADMRGFGEDLADSMYNKADNPELATGITTREFNRAWSSELLFDKNEISTQVHELTEDLLFTVAVFGHLENQFSAIKQVIKTNGDYTVTFGEGIVPLGQGQSGMKPPAGTYYVWFLYDNGEVTAQWTFPSREEATLPALSIPPNFVAVTGGEDQINISWDDVENEVGYEIYGSLNPNGPWGSPIATVAADETTYNHTGLEPGQHWYYRMRAIGEGAFASSGFTTSDAMTQDAGDTDYPIATFSPADSETGVPVNKEMVISMNKSFRAADGTLINTLNILDYIDAKEDDDMGSDVSVTGTVSGNTVTIRPNPIWPVEGNLYIAIRDIEDVNGNEAPVQAATFETSAFTLNAGNLLWFGDILDAVFSHETNDWDLIFTTAEIVFSGERTLYRKQDQSDTGGSGFIWYHNGADVYFFYIKTTSRTVVDYRRIKWPNAITAGEHGMRLNYDPTRNGNNGLDRADLYIDDVLVETKEMAEAHGSTWPFRIVPGVSQLRVGPTYAQVKGIQIKSNGGTVTEIDVPIARTGTDVSGNNRHGTWV